MGYRIFVDIIGRIKKTKSLKYLRNYETMGNMTTIELKEDTKIKMERLKTRLRANSYDNLVSRMLNMIKKLNLYEELKNE